MRVTVASDNAKLLALSLADVDEALEICEHTSLATFVALVRFFMARDSASLSAVAPKRNWFAATNVTGKSNATRSSIYDATISSQ